MIEVLLQSGKVCAANKRVPTFRLNFHDVIEGFATKVNDAVFVMEIAAYSGV